MMLKVVYLKVLTVIVSSFLLRVTMLMMFVSLEELVTIGRVR